MSNMYCSRGQVAAGSISQRRPSNLARNTQHIQGTARMVQTSRLPPGTAPASSRRTMFHGRGRQRDQVPARTRGGTATVTPRKQAGEMRAHRPDARRTQPRPSQPRPLASPPAQRRRSTSLAAHLTRLRALLPKTNSVPTVTSTSTVTPDVPPPALRILTDELELRDGLTANTSVLRPNGHMEEIRIDETDLKDLERKQSKSPLRHHHHESRARVFQATTVAPTTTEELTTQRRKHRKRLRTRPTTEATTTTPIPTTRPTVAQRARRPPPQTMDDEMNDVIAADLRRLEEKRMDAKTRMMHHVIEEDLRRLEERRMREEERREGGRQAEMERMRASTGRPVTMIMQQGQSRHHTRPSHPTPPSTMTTTQMHIQTTITHRPPHHHFHKHTDRPTTTITAPPTEAPPTEAPPTSTTTVMHIHTVASTTQTRASTTTFSASSSSTSTAGSTPAAPTTRDNLERNSVTESAAPAPPAGPPGQSPFNTPASTDGMPGALPPSDDIVNQLNTADDFLALARSLKIARVRAQRRRKRLAELTRV